MQYQYRHGGDWYGREEYLDFSANINPFGLPDSVRQQLEQSGAWCERYPDPFCRDLTRAIGQWEELPEDWILCGNGAADLIYRIAWAVQPGSALLPAPTFSEYERALLTVGCKIRRYQMEAGQGFDPGQNLLDSVDGADVVFLCNPNNPTGRLLPEGLLVQMASRCRAQNCALVVDECFLDFAETPAKHSAKCLLDQYPNLIIIKAFTKLFAMPGLRLGYALCSDQGMLEKLDQNGATWSVSVPAQRCGLAALQDAAYLERSLPEIRRQRICLEQGLRDCGLQVISGAANYLLFYCGDAYLDQKLLEKKIIIRSCADYQGLSPGWFRVAVRLEAENNALLRAIKEIVQWRETL